MKLNARRVGIFLLIVALSVAFGFAFDAGARALERKRYPIKASLADEVRRNAAEFAVPENILWAMMLTGSGFDSSKVSPDGAVGLMQLTPDEFLRINAELLGDPDAKPGEVYDPVRNLRSGAARLSSLYARYGVWKTVFAACFAGSDAVDAWLSDPDCVNELGVLDKIPDASVAARVKAVIDAAEHYGKLYFNS